MQPAIARETILVVDDEPQVLVALEDLLSDEFLVLKSDSAEKALRLVEQEPDVAVVISDQRMPRMHGDELFKRLRARFGAERILATGFADLTAVIRAVNDGQIFAYVTKPWDPEDLRVKIQRAAEHFRLSRDLAQERKLLEDLMNSMPDAIYFKDMDLKFQRVNHGLLRILGAASPAGVVGRTLSELLPDQELARALEEQEYALLRDNTATVDRISDVAVGGQRRWFSTSKAPILDHAGVSVGLVGIARDITQRKQQEARIERLTRIHAVLSGINSMILRVHDRTALLAESCTIAVRVGELALAVAVSMVSSKDDPVVAWDGSSRNLVDAVGSWLIAERNREGSVVDQAIAGRRPIAINDLRQQSALERGFAESLMAGGHAALAVLPVLVNGQVNCAVALFADHTGFFDEGQVKLLAELADNIGFALEHTAQAQRLDFLAYHDELTGLANRRLLTDRLSQQLAASDEDKLKLAIVLVDVERFRNVNETLGRRSGDEILIEIAQRLRAAADGKCALARYANNTFAVIVGPLDSESGVAQWVEKALALLSQSYVASGTELRLAARVGISLFPSDGSDADGLLANAEAALKKAKAGAQRYVFYTSAMNGRVAERLTLETKLRRAIEQNEFLLHYQPKVELKTGRVVGLEALIRWTGQDGKLIPPGLFIPLLEETGMIIEVGKWVIERAAAQHAEWLGRELRPPRIAVNVSPLQLGQPDFVGGLAEIQGRFPAASTGLDLEITESVLMEDLVGNTEKLRQAKQMGFGVAIDDFGTGYSSLGYLSRLPIDALKIDRSFVLRMSDDPQEMSIVTTIISLAHALDLKVIAEGVETQQQAQLLRLLKCDQIQGYLVARPQAADITEPLLTKTFDFSKLNA